MSILDKANFSNSEKVARGIPLNDPLTSTEIVNLWTNDKRERTHYRDAIFKEFESNCEKTYQLEMIPGCENETGPDFLRYWNVPVLTIYKKNFKEWIQREHEILPKHCSLLHWLDNDILDICKTASNEFAYTTWLRETWKTEGRPSGTYFFSSLKKYVGKENSPILAHTTSPNSEVILKSSTTTIPLQRIQIQKKVCKFINEEKPL